MNSISEKSIEEVRYSVQHKFPKADTSLLPESLIKRSLFVHESDVERASTVLCKLIKAKSENPQLFAGSLNDEKVVEAMGKNVTTINSRGPNGELIVVHDIKNWDTSKQSAKFLCMTDIFTAFCVSMSEEVLKNGIILIFNAHNCGWKHMRALEIFTTLAYIRIVAFGSPINVKSFCVFNANWACEKLDYVVRPLLPKSIAERIILAGSLEKLEKIIGKLDKEAILEPSESDIKVFIETIDASAQSVVEEWQQIDKMFK